MWLKELLVLAVELGLDALQLSTFSLLLLDLIESQLLAADDQVIVKHLLFCRRVLSAATQRRHRAHGMLLLSLGARACAASARLRRRRLQAFAFDDPQDGRDPLLSLLVVVERYRHLSQADDVNLNRVRATLDFLHTRDEHCFSTADQWVRSTSLRVLLAFIIHQFLPIS